MPPELVFAHPIILKNRPTTFLYYRGIELLSRKHVRQADVAVTFWEDRTRGTPVPKDKALKAARIYDAIISSIIEGSTDRTLENGYRNILETMGITLDGMLQNEIGEITEAPIKNWIAARLKVRGLVTPKEPPDSLYELPNGTLMQFES